MSQAPPRVIVYSYSFDEKNGGVIALLALCERLRALGHDAMIWPIQRRLRRRPVLLRTWASFLRHPRSSVRSWRFTSGPFDVPVARPRHLRGAVVVYPELVAGNPLRSARVVRWLLHRPGFLSGVVDFGPDDVLFHYQDAFASDGVASGPSRRLTVTWTNPAYRDLGGSRSGTCVLVRKGSLRGVTPPPGTEVVDDLDHDEMAAVFNRVEYLLSYDEYTMYTTYAALCGCIPVIDPVPGLTKEQWLPDEADRYGLAYGWDDVPWAVATRPLLVQRIAQRAQEEEEMVQQFLDIVSTELSAPDDGPVGRSHR